MWPDASGIIGRSRYLLTFTDDFSRYTTAYFIKSKSEVLSKFMECVRSVEKHAGYQIMKLTSLADKDVKILRTSNSFTRYCAEKGITRVHCSLMSTKWSCWTLESHNFRSSKIYALPSQVTTEFPQKPAAQLFTFTIEVPQQH